MKKFLIYAFLIGFIGFNVSLVAIADTSIKPVNITADKVPAIIINIATWFYRIVLVVAVFFALVAAFNYLTGNTKNVEKAHKQLLYVVIGIAVALLSWGIVTIVTNTLNQR